MSRDSGFTDRAAALTDADANPTVPGVGAYLMAWDGTQWKRVQAAAGGSGALKIAFAGSTQSADGLSASEALTLLPTGGSVALAAAPWLHNGATLDRQRNNVEGTALVSAARTATTQSADIINYNGRGVNVFFDITVVPGAQTVTLSIEEKDPVSGKYVQVFAGAAESAVVTKRYSVYPGVAETANVDFSSPLARTFRVVVTHSGAGSFTYSVGYCIVL